MGVLPMPERKMTLRKARCGHIDVTVDMLYPLKSGEIKYLYTFKYIKIDVKYKEHLIF